MKFGADTSVVVRLLVGEPADQALLARQRLELARAAGDTVIVSDLAVAEAYFALQHHYSVPREEARELLRSLLRSGVVSFDPATSLGSLDPSRGAGLVDRLIVARHRALGASTWTFDRKLGALEGAERLSRSRR